MINGIARCYLDTACGCIILPHNPPKPRFVLVNGLPGAIIFDYGCSGLKPISPDYFIEGSKFVKFASQSVVRFYDRTTNGCPAISGHKLQYFVYSS